LRLLFHSDNFANPGFIGAGSRATAALILNLGDLGLNSGLLIAQGLLLGIDVFVLDVVFFVHLLNGLLCLLTVDATLVIFVGLGLLGGAAGGPGRRQSLGKAAQIGARPVVDLLRQLRLLHRIDGVDRLSVAVELDLPHGLIAIEFGS